MEGGFGEVDVRTLSAVASESQVSGSLSAGSTLDQRSG